MYFGFVLLAGVFLHSVDVLWCLGLFGWISLWYCVFGFSLLIGVLYLVVCAVVFFDLVVVYWCCCLFVSALFVLLFGVCIR